MQKQWNKLILYAVAVGFKNLINRVDELAGALGAHQTRKVDPNNPTAHLPLADQYSAAVKNYKKELGL